MFEYLICPVIGFVGTLLALEGGWHFTACGNRDKTRKACMFKQIGLVLPETRGSNLNIVQGGNNDETNRCERIR